MVSLRRDLLHSHRFAQSFSQVVAKVKIVDAKRWKGRRLQQVKRNAIMNEIYYLFTTMKIAVDAKRRRLMPPEVSS